ncbi:MAG: hypothetical protein KME31_11915 [Tolypothrix carrinoi HA7290-LM1]|jgi:hypothetical protein|nr:hypothetical protein [Tolypothrix carrinoi HA7290-LM1]
MRSHSPDWMNHLHYDDFTEISRLLHRRSVRTTSKKFLYNHLYRRFISKNSVTLHVYRTYAKIIEKSIIKVAVIHELPQISDTVLLVIRKHS